MERQPASEPDQAYGAAATFIDALATLAWHARRYQRDPANPDGWTRLGGTYAQAFVAWFDLSHLLTAAVRDAARRAYPVGAASIRVGKLKAKGTVIEAIADELGVYFRNVLYQGRRHPLDPDRERVIVEAKAQAVARQVAEGKLAEPFGWGEEFNELMKKETRAVVRERLGVKTLGDAWLLMAREWESQDPARAESRLKLLLYSSIDFDDLRTQLDREARAVIPPSDALIATATMVQAMAQAGVADALARIDVSTSMLPVDPNADAPPRRPVTKPDGWARADLVAQAKDAAGSFSASTFDNIRRAANVEAGERGGKGQQRRFSRVELTKLIEAVEAGTFRNRTEIANSWRELLAQ